MKNKKIILTVTILIMALFLCLLSCQKAEPPKLLKAKWGGPRNISMAPIIADKKEFFKKEGLDVESLYIQTGKVAMDALISGDIDFAVIVETNVAFIKYQQGANIEIICSIEDKYDDAIVVRKDKGIQSPEDLKGKTIAVTTGTTSHVYAYRFLAHNGLEKDVSFMNLTPLSIQASLLTGDIVAGSIWQPYRYNVLNQLKDKTIEFNDTSVYKAYAVVAVRKKYAQNHSEEIKRFLKALIKAEDHIRTHSDEAIAVLAQELKLEKDLLKAIWHEYDIAIRLEPGLLKTIKQEGKWIKETQNGFGDKLTPSYDDVINPAFLKSIAPERVN
ncbi:MAG: hypothetical protein BA867_06440 [Desulfobacterales bacterium S5133MH16]|nr:MAG: hypothetical protein BA867_06440 [Desulfobacterales bacterium S5133MH16]